MQLTDHIVQMTVSMDSCLVQQMKHEAIVQHVICPFCLMSGEQSRTMVGMDHVYAGAYVDALQ